MQPFSFLHREQNISKQNYKISAVQEIRLSLEFFMSFSTVYTILGFGIEVWLIPFRGM